LDQFLELLLELWNKPLFTALLEVRMLESLILKFSWNFLLTIFWALALSYVTEELTLVDLQTLLTRGLDFLELRQNLLF